MARFCNFSLGHRLSHGTSWLLVVHAIVEFALGQPAKELGKMVVQRVPLQGHKPKPFDARRVHQEPAFGQRMHLGKRGGVPAFVVRIAHLGRFDLKSRDDAVDQGALAHARMAGQDVNPFGQFGFQLFHPLARVGAHFQPTVARIAVHFRQGFCLHPVFVRQRIHLVQHDGGGDAVRFSGDQKPVHESRARAWRRQRHDKKGTVQVGGHDVALVRQVDRFADDAIGALVDVGNDPGAIFDHLKIHHISHGHRVGGPITFQSKLARWPA